MRDTIDKVLKLGLGIVIAGKEQIEKTVEELVEKGEVSRSESKALVDEWLNRGEEAKSQIQELVKQRIDTLIQEANLATKEDIARIEQRLDQIEQTGRAVD